jgi:hypothetical protein
MPAVALGAVPRFAHHRVSRLYSVAHLFPKAERCGVYILGFTGGERYVGQSVNVVTRFGTHRRTYGDIEFLDFCPCPRARLAELERAVIQGQRDCGFQLRNVTHARGPLGESDLDPLISPAEQYAWLNDGGETPDVPSRVDDPEQRERHHATYLRLRQHPWFGLVAVILGDYVQETIAKPRQTERTFWSLGPCPAPSDPATVSD